MSSITIKDIPEALLRRIRERAAADRRSINKEVIHLVETALAGGHVNPTLREQMEAQAAAWSELAGAWQDGDVDAAAETRAIYAARTAGRPVDL